MHMLISCTGVLTRVSIYAMIRPLVINMSQMTISDPENRSKHFEVLFSGPHTAQHSTQLADPVHGRPSAKSTARQLQVATVFSFLSPPPVCQRVAGLTGRHR